MGLGWPTPRPWRSQGAFVMLACAFFAFLFLVPFLDGFVVHELLVRFWCRDVCASGTEAEEAFTH